METLADLAYGFSVALTPYNLLWAALGVTAMVKGPRWQAILEERGWLDLYLPRAEYATFLDEEEARGRETLGVLGMLPQ